MTGNSKSIDGVLRQADEQLLSARIGLALMKAESADKKSAGLRNVIVFARAFTNALQNLRSVTTDFDEWYGPWQQRLKDDPIALMFYRMRSEILKEGLTNTHASVHINHLNTNDTWPFAPPKAIAFFIGDPQGRSGWVVQNEDGTTDRLYVELSPQVGDVKIELFIKDLPDDLAAIPASELAERFLDLLDQVFVSAKARFKARAAPSGTQ